VAALRSPAFTPLWRHEDEHVLIYGRGEGEPAVIVALNFHEDPQVVRVPAPGPRRGVARVPLQPDAS
jgi:hypothetical protein